MVKGLYSFQVSSSRCLHHYPLKRWGRCNYAPMISLATSTVLCQSAGRERPHSQSISSCTVDSQSKQGTFNPPWNKQLHHFQAHPGTGIECFEGLAHRLHGHGFYLLPCIVPLLNADLTYMNNYEPRGHTVTILYYNILLLIPNWSQ